MNLQVFTHLLSWYLLIFISGIIFWITFHPFFSKLADRGYAVSKVCLLVINAIVLWTLGFLFKLPLNSITVITSLVILAGLCIFIRFKFKIPLPKVSKKLLIITELVFLFILIATLFVTSIHPTIDNVTERIMDFNLLNVLTVTDNLPAIDVWFSPLTVNYYYFGYFFFSLINKITFTDAFMGYLFSMGFIYPICGTVIFSIARSIKKNYAFAVLSTVFVLFFSNFSFIYNLIEKFFNSIGNENKITFIVSCIDLLVILSIIYSLVFVNRRNTRIFLIITLPIVLLHFYLIKGSDSIISFYNFLLDPTKANLWFPDVSRVIDSTINEFPYYSIVIGDLHPHYLDLVFLPVMLALLFLDFKQITPRKANYIFTKLIKPIIKASSKKERLVLSKALFKDKKFLKIFFIKLLSLFIFSAGIATNSWEAICFGIFIGIKDLVFIFRAIRISSVGEKVNIKKLALISAIPILLDAFIYLGAFFIQTPYLRSIQIPVKGIKLNLINNSTDYFTFFKNNFDLLSFFKLFTNDNNGNFKVLFGFDKLIILVLTILAIRYTIKYLRQNIISKKIFAIQILGTIVLGIISSAFLAVTVSYVQSNFDLSPLHEFFKVWFIFYLLSGVALFFLIKKLRRQSLSKSEYFILTSIITGITLSIFTEFFYVADYFDRVGYQHHRANTVFKVNYIGFVFFGIVCAWAIFKILNSSAWQKRFKDKFYFHISSAFVSLLRTFIIVVVILTFMYVPYSLNQWINYFPENIRFSLDSYAKTKIKYPDMIEATDFFKTIKKKGDVILESNGDGYQYQDIASVYTVTPTVLGWWGHEAQWRETKDPTVVDNMLNDRVAEVSKVYNLTTGWQNVIKKYNINYVWVTDAERTKQNENVTNIFENQACFNRIFQNTTVKIYKVDNNCVNDSIIPGNLFSPIR